MAIKRKHAAWMCSQQLTNVHNVKYLGASMTRSEIVGQRARNLSVTWSTCACGSWFSYLIWSLSSVNACNFLLCYSCSQMRSSCNPSSLCVACWINPNNCDNDQCCRVSTCIVFGSGKLLWMGRSLAIEFSEWDGSEVAGCEVGVNWGVGGTINGFGISGRFIGKEIW